MAIIKLPGLLDPHIHLRDPGATHKEDFTTGTAAALAGGITTLIDMPNNPEPTVSLEALKKKLAIAEKKALVDVGFHFGASQDDNTEEFSKVIDRVLGLKVYMGQTTGTLLVEDKKLLEKIFAVWPKEKPLLVHAEEKTLEKAIKIAQKTGRRIHCCHVSLSSEVKMIKRAKDAGLPVTFEVCPHHLFLTEDDVKNLGPYGRMKPPLRSKKDVEFLWRNIKFVDMIATDHAPHTRAEKEGDKPPYGVPGLETSLSLMLTAVYENRLTLNDVRRLMFDGPAKLYSFKQDKNTFIEVDLSENWIVQQNELKTKCRWSPFGDWRLRGRVKQVTIRGKLAYDSGRILVKPGFGKFIKP